MGKKSHFIVILLLLVLKGNAVSVETTSNLNVYYPEYTKIDLVCGQMPKVAQKDVEFAVRQHLLVNCLMSSNTRTLGTTISAMG